MTATRAPVSSVAKTGSTLRNDVCAADYAPRYMSFASIIRDFRTAPVAVKPATVKPTGVTVTVSRADAKQAMAAGLARAHEDD
jgi:hypothetical protein